MIAFFPGKFHPPHLGHLRSIMYLMKKYDTLIVGVSEHIPEAPITTVDNIIGILDSFFEYFDNVELTRIKGTLIHKTDLSGLPLFDVLVSGNQDVLDWAEKMGIKYEFMPRSEGYLFSGTEIRNELQNF